MSLGQDQQNTGANIYLSQKWIIIALKKIYNKKDTSDYLVVLK